MIVNIDITVSSEGLTIDADNLAKIIAAAQNTLDAPTDLTVEVL